MKTLYLRFDIWMLQAHRVGAITSLCRTPWGNLWTGTSRGWIRIWDCADPGAFNDAGEYALPMRELRRHGGARPHIGSVSHMICPAGGQVSQQYPLKTFTAAFNYVRLSCMLAVSPETKDSHA